MAETYNCQYCQEAFGDPIDLVYHEHGCIYRLYVCFCGLTFNNKRDREAHLSSVNHGDLEMAMALQDEARHICLSCRLEYDSVYAWAFHMCSKDSDHPVESTP
jgi:hypothetical protein